MDRTGKKKEKNVENRKEDELTTWKRLRGKNEGKRWMVRNLFVRTNGSPKAKMRKMDDS